MAYHYPRKHKDGISLETSAAKKQKDHSEIPLISRAPLCNFNHYRTEGIPR